MFLLRDGDISWTPAVDVCERKNQWLVYIELPGVSSDEIDLIVYPESVLIKGTKTPPVMELSAERIKINTGCFHREIHIPGRICMAFVTASMKNGVLSLILPAEEQASVGIPAAVQGNKLRLKKEIK